MASSKRLCRPATNIKSMILQRKKALRAGAPFSRQDLDQSYLILVSLNSTCFLATGSYFIIENFSVLVRAFLDVT